MRRYRQILAGVLAASLMISSVPMDAQARSAYQAHESNQAVSQEYTGEQFNIDGTDDTSDTTSAPSDNGYVDGDSGENITEDNSGDVSDDISDSDSSTGTEDNTTDDVTDDPATTEDIVPEDGQDTQNMTSENVSATDATADVEQDLQDDVAEISAVGTLSLDALTADSANTHISNRDGSVYVENVAALILLSNCEASDIKDLTITTGISGDADLTGSASWKGNTYKFIGIGTEDVPFKGSLSIGADVIIDTSLFGGITSGANVSITKLTWKGKGSVPMFAGKYEFSDPYEHNFPVTISATSNGGTVQSGAVMGTLIGTVSGEPGTLNISGDKVKYTSNTVGVSVSGNAGFICGTLGAGCTIKMTGYTLPSGKAGAGTTAAVTCDVSSTNGSNAGGLIGEMGEDSKLYIDLSSEQNIVNLNVSTTAGGTGTGTGTGTTGAASQNGGNAGGIVGYAATGSEIEITSTNGLTLSSATITGVKTAGGVAGNAENMQLLESSTGGKLTIKGATLKATNVSDGSVGGAFGKYSMSGSKDNTLEQTLSSRLLVGADSDSKITVTGSAYTGTTGNANGIGSPDTSVQIGGLIGYLCLENSKFIIDGKTVYVGSAGNERSYGGLIGHVVGTSQSGDKSLADSALVIKDSTANSSYVKHAYFHGGIVGEIGQTGDESQAVYLEVNGVTASVSSPWAGRDGNVEDLARGFGGIVSRVAENSVLKLLGTNTVSTNDPDRYAWQGGGVVGWAADGSAVEFNGITDLSGTNIKQRYYSAALVAGQGNALIYAHGDGNGTNGGWKYIRSKNVQAVDDIGNYGQVIRLKMSDTDTTGLPTQFITMDETTHKVSLSKAAAGSYSGDTISIGGTAEFAQLAVTWQSQGYFSADEDITHDNWQTINSKNITLTGNVVLTGTGINGLARDSVEYLKNGKIDVPDTSEDYTYRGTFDGGNNTVTLAIGEAYGFRNDSAVKNGDKASGIIHGHAYNGIFAAVTGDVKNVTINGKIYVSGVRFDQFNDGGRLRDIFVGGYAALADGEGEKIAENVTINVEESLSTVDENSSMVSVYAGGLYGCIKRDSTINIGSAGNPVTSGTIIKIVKNGNNSGKYIYGGGLIGTVSDFNITVNCDAVVLKGDISSDVTTMQAGGLIGWINYSSSKNRTINIKGIEIKDQKITSEQAAANGGLFGYLWADTKVNFVTPQDKAKYALQIDSSTLTLKASDAAIGGLVYRASGKWTINDHGINMAGATFVSNGDANSNSIGMLVCHGGNESNTSRGNKRALYLEMTENWSKAYVIDPENVTINAAKKLKIFDEFVAYTVLSGGTGGGSENIMKNDMNGIISLATVDHKGVATGTECNTYVNRTKYGKEQPENAYSRYYYNLDYIKRGTQTGSTSGKYADSAEKLLMWSVWKYASESIKSEFDVWGVDSVDSIGSDSHIVLDMRGLSYYPVSVDYVTVKNADIKFYNSDIESYEKTASNKKTSVTSQHYMMHFGLFYNVTGGITVDTVKFAGSIGRCDDGSGVLCSGTISGSSSTSINTVTANDLTLDGIFVTDAADEYAPVLINNIGGYTTFSFAKVRTEGYSGIRSAAGSSLVGRVGSGNSDTQITGSFNDVKLPGKAYNTDGGIFTHSTFLESFQYRNGGVASIVYNFYKEEDWKDGTHVNNVTYGKEISDSVQYPDLQRWYYDKEGYNTDSGRVRFDMNGNVEDTSDFSGYLPYVHQGYNVGSRYYEIVVNQRMSDLLTGCGTYGHPYVITDALEMNSIAAYLGTKSAKKGWKIRITSDQENYHTESDDTGKDIVYLCDGENWKEAEYNTTTKDWTEKNGGIEISNDLMHNYLLSAYYDIQAPTDSTDSNKNNVLTLADFAGLGTEDYAFRGVIVSTKGSTVKLTGDAGNGFIRYSYGSVLKNITIKYSGSGRNLTYNSTSGGQLVESLKPAQSGNAKYSPAVFWGGVIGCILGGDNIIDNVNVIYESSWSLVLDGDVNNLIEAGGYVGSVAGGGVIFRNMTGKSNLSDTNVKRGTSTGSQDISVSDENKSFYVNPYVGRVLDGYAFSEGCTIDNGNKNYKINMLSKSGTGGNDITTVSTDKKQFTTTIKNAQGLLVFSAIVNSGAAAGGDQNNNGTKAYSGMLKSYNVKTGDSRYHLGNGIYGKVRNASYKYVGGKISGSTTGTGTGTDESAIAEDFKKSLSDDMKSPGCADINSADLNSDTNAPYLIRTYSNDMTYYVSAWNGSSYSKLTIELANGKTYDMKNYGNGYQGITARYVSSAIDTGDPTGNWGAPYVKPLITGFNGNNSTITNVSMDVKEYAQDDFHSVSVGGVFNLIRAPKSSELTDGKLVENLNIASGRVSLTYYYGSGVRAADAFNSYPSISSAELGYICVGVGGFAGNSSQNGINSVDDARYTMEKIGLTNVTVSGPITAGGIMGSTSMGNNTLSYDAGLMFRNRTADKNNFGANLVDCTYTGLDIDAGYFAGGFVGYAGNNEILISNDIFKDGNSTNNLTSSLTVTEEKYSNVGSNSTINTSCSGTPNKTVSAAGGAFGALTTKLYINNDTEVTAVFTNITSEAKDTTIYNKTSSFNAGRYADAGSVIGHVANSDCTIRNVEVIKEDDSDVYVNGWADSGGLVGCINSEGNRNILIEKCKVTGVYIKDSYLNSGALIGGFYEIAGDHKIQIKSCELSSVNVFGQDSVGGFVGCNRGSMPILVDGCKAVDVKVNDADKYSSKGWNGLILGSMGDSSAVLYLYDTVMKDCTVQGNVTAGISSSLHKIVYGSNILMDNITVKCSGSNSKKGLLFGSVENSYENMYLAGISIKNCSGSLNDAGKLGLGSKGYIAFADYTDKAQATGVTHSSSLLGTTAVAPYVVTSPENTDSNSLELYEKAGSATNPVSPEYLYGDSVSWSKNSSGNFDMLGEQILNDVISPTGDIGKRYRYSSIGDEAKNFDFASNFSTYNSNQTTKAANDFPVLQITGGVTDGIAEYLDIVTNGGYSQARSCSAVTVDETVYKYTKGKFIKSSTETSPLTVLNNGKNTMSFAASSDYDNDKDRFTLLTVKFKPDNDNDHVYYVNVPVIVRRVLEVDFTATLSYGTHFNSEDYKDLTGHVLESYGNPMTGYLTYTYGSMFGKEVTYGWQSYVDAGGDVAQSMEKKIRFAQSAKLPEGTQLTLIDCQDENRTAYYYTVTGQESGSGNAGKEFSFSDFVSSSNKKFSSGSIGERIGIAVSEDKSGNFIEVQSDGRPLKAGATDTTQYPDATVKCGDHYYRLKSSVDKVNTSTKYYSVKMEENTFSENYYLVVTMKDPGDGRVANGSVLTSFDGTIPYNIHYMRRKEKDEDKHSNSASTYQVSSGYKQVLTESLTGARAIKEVTAADSILKVSVKDEITFPNGQAYTSSDQLYQRFVTNLQITKTGENGTTSTNYTQFPSGTAGRVRFYVYTEDATSKERQYYKCYFDDSDENNKKWVWNSAEKINTPGDSDNTEDTKCAVAYNWTSDGGNMELLLSKDGTIDNVISLQGLRDLLKGGKSDGNSTFFIEAIMDAELSTLGLDVIPESTLTNGIPENYAKLNYVAQISTEKSSLAYSSTRATLANTWVSYYQQAASGSKLTYNADNINQLGINLLDLGDNLDKDKTHSIIATTAVYDLHEIKNLESMLKSSDHIRFSLTLSRKNDVSGNTESYVPISADADSYISVGVNSPNSGKVTYAGGVWSWDVPKSSYIDVNTNMLKTDGVFDGTNVVQAITLMVDVERVEALEHFYSNYDVVLSAQIVGADGKILDGPASDDIIYTLTRIKPEFIDNGSGTTTNTSTGN